VPDAPPRSWPRAIGLFVAVLSCSVARAQWPSGFTSVPIASGWQQPVGIAFAPSGALFVFEKGGRVWSVVGGVKSAQPILDIAEEVGDWRDHGMLGFAVDPNFASNGRIYAGYVVDYHHLRWFGTPQYSPTTNEYFRDTIARVTRFTLDPTTFVLVPGSRTVLIGESIASGIPVLNQSHGMGSLVFGSDGTLLVSSGDGASYDAVDGGGPAAGSSNTGLLEGIIRAKENVGAFRAQLVDSLCGKVLRIDPATGNGVRSNPFFVAANPRAPQSRVWALGLRNPFRMSRQIGTGSTDPLAGDPGTLWIGDVGWNAYEEVDVCDGPGLNFGWPLHEGLSAHASYVALSTQNLDAPNPLFGTGGCTAQYFAFRDLLVQDTLGVPAWPNPCNATMQIPATIPRFEHARSPFDWGHGSGARAKAYVGNSAAIVNVGAIGAPIQGAQFQGSSATGGAWYAGNEYPAQYAGSYFFGDYVGGFIRRYVPGNPGSISLFAATPETSGLVFLATAPGTGALHYIRYAELGTSSEVRRVVHTVDLPPVAVASPAVAFGPVPFLVQFSSAGSTDPEGQPLQYAWDFGDGTTSTLAHPTHLYEPIADITSQGTFVARVLELSPPQPQGGGNTDPAVLRDGDYPPVGSGDDLRQYDTFHNGAQGNFDWLGYSFTSEWAFRGLIFQEGKHFVDGGWFDDWRVEVKSGTTWTTVAGAVMTPAYPGNNGVNYQTFRIDFPAAIGTHVRIAGAPGGSGDFISAGEVRVLALDPALLTQPVRRDVTLTVRDPSNGTGSTTAIVSLNNTPPNVAITSPIDGSLYALGPLALIPLNAAISDAEHSGAQLACEWQTALHHDKHSHPEPIDPNCATSTVITPEGCDGAEYHFEIHLTVTDAAGLATTAEAHIYPDCAPVAICAGDGSGAACPCGNFGGAGRGCENSLTTGGGWLTGAGSARLSNDALTLTATGLPTSATALFFQGETALATGFGVAFGDGLRCAGGEIRRLGVIAAAGGSASIGAAGGASLSVAGAVPAEGGVRTYQTWYRNSATFCTSSTFNLTNGLRITWVP